MQFQAQAAENVYFCQLIDKMSKHRNSSKLKKKRGMRNPFNFIFVVMNRKAMSFHLIWCNF